MRRISILIVCLLCPLLAVAGKVASPNGKLTAVSNGKTLTISYNNKQVLDVVDAVADGQSLIFVRKRKANEKADPDEPIFMAAPELIGYDATGRKTESQLDEIIEKFEEFQKDATPFFA